MFAALCLKRSVPDVGRSHFSLTRFQIQLTPSPNTTSRAGSAHALTRRLQNPPFFEVHLTVLRDHSKPNYGRGCLMGPQRCLITFASSGPAQRMCARTTAAHFVAVDTGTSSQTTSSLAAPPSTLLETISFQLPPRRLAASPMPENCSDIQFLNSGNKATQALICQTKAKWKNNVGYSKSFCSRGANCSCLSVWYLLDIFW